MKTTNQPTPKSYPQGSVQRETLSGTKPPEK